MTDPATTTSCRDCGMQIDPTGAMIPTLCPDCYGKQRVRVQTDLEAMVSAKPDISTDELLDEMRWQLLELGMARETAERSIDRLRVSLLLKLPWDAVADR